MGAGLTIKAACKQGCHLERAQRREISPRLTIDGTLSATLLLVSLIQGDNIFKVFNGRFTNRKVKTGVM